jgi:pimeloyl-ACP methyl ester carboxylesterase
MPARPHHLVIPDARGIRRVLATIAGHRVAADVHLRPDDPRPPVVFLHGMMTSLAIADEVFVAPAEESWIAISLPGHAPGGFAAGHDPAAIDAELFARLIEGMLEELVGSRPVIAVGWSTGGFAALTLALFEPQRVVAVASFAGFARGRCTGAIGWFQWLARGAVGRICLHAGLRLGGSVPAVHDAVVRLGAADAAAGAAVPPAVLARLRGDFARHDPEALVAMLAAIDRLDITPRLGEICVPAWIVGGGRDPFVPREETERVAAGIPNATLRIHESAGHLFFSEWPGVREEFAAWRDGLAVASASR